MLDIKYIRDHQEKVKKNCFHRKVKADIDGIIALDDKRKALQTEIDSLRQQLNAGSKQKPTPEEIERLRGIGAEIAEHEADLKMLQITLNQKLSYVPNMLAPEVPVGKDDNDNIEIKAWTMKDGYLSQDTLGKKDISKSTMPIFSFPARDHVDLGKRLDIIDVEQSAKVSGSRFAYLKNEAVLLEYALFELLKNKLLAEGFTPMIVPLLVKQKALFGSSHFPEEADQVYRIDSKNVEEDELYLVGSSEPSLFAYYMDKTISEKELPIKMFAFTPCFRSEVGSWGKDVRGIKRVHQFDKLEMDTITMPGKSEEMHEYLLSLNEWLLQQLELPYHVLLMCSGDSGYAAAHKKYDVEVWLPSQLTFMEVMSDTNATDFQARRLKIRYKDEKDTSFAHTVNDTGVAMGRMIIAILDNYQQKDGSVIIPDVLQQYVGKEKISPKK